MKRLLIMMLGISLVFAGCGERGGSDAVITVEDPEEYNPVDLVLAAVKQTESASSFRVDFVLKLTGVPFFGEIVQPVSIEQAANGDNSVVIDLSDATAGGENVSEIIDEAVDYVIEMRQVGDLLYLSLPEEDLGLYADTPWVSIARDQVTEEELDYFESFDPNEQLNFLLATDENATISLGEKVRGVTATRISGEYTFLDVLNSLDVEEQQEMIESFISDVASQDAGEEEVISNLDKIHVEFDVWIGEEGYILRDIVLMKNWEEFFEAVNPEVSDAMDELEDFEMYIETYYFDYDAPITIVAPPSEDVTPYDGSIDDLLG